MSAFSFLIPYKQGEISFSSSVSRKNCRNVCVLFLFRYFYIYVYFPTSISESLTQKKNMMKQQRIGRLFGTIESVLSLCFYGFLGFDRFTNIFFLPFRLKSSRLYLAPMIPPLLISMIELILCGLGVALQVKLFKCHVALKRERWINRLLLLIILFIDRIYLLDPFGIMSFDEEITYQFVKFIGSITGGFLPSRTTC